MGNKITRFSGIFGLILFVIGLIFYSFGVLFKVYGFALIVSGLILIVFYIVYNVDLVKHTVKMRSTQYTLNAVVFVLILITIIGFLNYLNFKHFKRYDFTENKIHSLSPKTVNILKNLKKSITVYGFFKPKTREKQILHEILKVYSYETEKFKYKFIDPDASPLEAKEFGIDNYGISVIKYEDRKEQFKGFSEEVITNTILKATRKQWKTIYYAIGHGEHSFEIDGPKSYLVAKKELEKMNYTVRHINLLRIKEIPFDCSALIIAGPQKPYDQKELDVIENFIERGGSVLMLLNPTPSPGFDKFCKNYGIIVDNTIIIDKLSKMMGTDYVVPIVNKYAVRHEMLKNFNYNTCFPMVRSVRIEKTHIPKIFKLELLKTMEGSWAEKNWHGQIVFDNKEDIIGPVSIAALSVKTIKSAAKKEDEIDKENKKEEKPIRGKLIVVGDSDFASKNYFKWHGNGELFLHFVNWLAEEKDLVAIGAKAPGKRMITLKDTDSKSLFFFVLLFIPGIFFVIGILVWNDRRR